MSISAEQLVAACDTFLEAASKISREKAKARDLSALERRLERRVKHVFTVQQAATLRRLRPLAPEFPTPVREALKVQDVESLLDAVLGGTRKLFERALESAVSAAAAFGSQFTLGEVGAKVDFTVQDPAVVAFLRQYGAERVTLIDQATREQLRAILVKGAQEGWSHRQVAKAITDRFAEFRFGKPQQHIRSRAHLIAITEVGEAYEQGTLMTARAIATAGTPMEKFWLTVGDDRVSDGCRENQGAGWVGLEVAFPSGHQRPLRFPGCRCALITRRKPE